MKWRRYPKYKDSGIEWLGEVPEHWDELKLKFISSVQFSNVDKHTKEDETPVRLCNYVDVYYNDHITSDLDFMIATATADEIRKFKLKQGDVLITKDSESWDDIAIPAVVNDVTDGVICGYHLAQIRPMKDRIEGQYLFRAFASSGVKEQFMVAATGVTRFGIGMYAIANALFPLPPVAEQHTIATFLDRETARIDTLIGKKQRQIELLKEKRAALISHAVTKGLDPNVKMKDSGIEWLGEVPEHWEIRRVKRISSKIGSGKTPRGGAEVYVDVGVMLLRSQNIHFDGLRLDDVVFIEPEVDEKMANSRVRGEDILLNITGASLGRCSIIPMEFPCANVNQHVCIIRVRRDWVLPAYVSYAFSSRLVQSQIFANENGTSREGLNFQQVGDLIICLPPDLDEQCKVVHILDEEVARTQTLITSINNSMAMLREYRTALISAAVTGKIDVRKEVAR